MVDRVPPKPMFKPKLVSLDTSSWDLLTKQQSAACGRIQKVFASGSVIPFFTSTHLEELMQHGNQSVVEARQMMLRRLPFVTYLRGRNSGHGDVGWLLDLREAEFDVLCEQPQATAEIVVEQVRQRVANRFRSGQSYVIAMSLNGDGIGSSPRPFSPTHQKSPLSRNSRCPA